MGPVIRQDDVDEQTIHEVDIAFVRRRLGAAAGARGIGLSHYVIAPGGRGMPVHVHGDEEELFYVLRGHGIGYELGAEAYPIAAGDVIVQRPEGRPHTRLADADGELELLAFGSGSDTGSSYLPRAGVMWNAPHWIPLDAPHPFRAESRAGPLERPQTLGERPPHVVARDAVPAASRGGRTTARLGAAAGAVAAGLNHCVLEPGARTTAHCHTLEEEIIYVLAGSGTVTLGDDEHPLAAGAVIARPPSSGVTHQLTAGEDGLTYLIYGTRQPGDAIYLPERGVVRITGLGVSLPIAPQ